jgi:hypothetical protein
MLLELSTEGKYPGELDTGKEMASFLLIVSFLSEKNSTRSL